MCDDNNTSTLDGGHRMTRRGAIGAGAAGGVALWFAGRGRFLDTLGPDFAEAASGTCTMTPAKTVGPYIVEEKLNRSDVRTNTSDGAVQAGVPLTLRLQVFDADHDCAPVTGATVDIWHANATGLYSDVAGNDTAATGGGKTVASRKVTLHAGTRALKVTIPASTKTGAAKLKLTLNVTAGNTKSYNRTVHIHSARI